MLLLLLLLWAGPSHASIASSSVSFTIQEEQPPGILVGNIKHDGNIMPMDKQYRLKLRANSYFFLNAENGELRTKTKIDLESICRGRPVGCDVLHVIAKACDAMNSLMVLAYVEISVKIADKNDHAPIFRVQRPDRPGIYRHTLAEKFSSPRQTTVPVPAAVDADYSAAYSRLTYSLVGCSEMFSLITNQSPKLRLLKELDREKKQNYTLTIQAQDAEGKRGELKVIIIVKGIDDNPAVFSSSLKPPVSTVSVSESTPVDTIIFNKESLRARLDSLESLVCEFLNKSAKCSRRSEAADDNNATSTAQVGLIDDCSEVKTRALRSGVFVLRSTGRTVKCTERGELVALERTRGDVDFNRNWTDYRDGFGDARIGDYWVGLKYLSTYTSAGDRCMRLELTPWRLRLPQPAIMRYSGIDIGPETDKYRLAFTESKGNVHDSFGNMKDQEFSTRDVDNDAYVGNCAQVFGGGNWYKSCSSANIFGRHKYLPDEAVNKRRPEVAQGDPMCWRGLDKSQGDMCSPLTTVRMVLARIEEVGIGRRVVFSQVATADDNCKSTLRSLSIPSTGFYYITLGGAAGGMSNQYAPGGRGARVRAKMFLKRGRKLVIVAGCGYKRYNSYNGHGGDATWLVDEEKWKPILVAGGGGGAAYRTPGMHGREEETGGSAWWTSEEPKDLTVKDLLRPSIMNGGYGWSKCVRGSSECRTGYRVNRRHRGGGGGGGFKGAASGTRRHASGGGGGSFCDLQQTMECLKDTGGNTHQVGFLIMEKSTCF